MSDAPDVRTMAIRYLEDEVTAFRAQVKSPADGTDMSDGERMVESRHRFELLESVPDDWRFIRNEFDPDKNPDHAYWALYTHAVEDDLIRVRKWVELRRIEQRRSVTPWVDVPEPGGAGQ